MKFGLYLGCQIPFLRPDVEASIRRVMDSFDIKLVDLEGYSCCPNWISAPSYDIDAWLAISARNISIAEDKGVDIITGCNNCYSVLNHAKYLLEDFEKRERINRILSKIGRYYRGSSKVYHVVHVFSDFLGVKAIKDSIEFSLDDIVAAVQPGCNLLWPTRIMNLKEENPFYPKKLRNLVEALGAEAPHYSRIEYCCGMGSMRTIDYSKSVEFVLTKLMSIKEEIDPDLIVTACSSCYIQLDEIQGKLKKEGKIDFEIPVFYYTQLLAICMGIEPELVLKISTIPKDSVVRRIVGGKRARI